MAVITYSNVSDRLLRTLSDPDQKTYKEELVYDAIVAAHDAILPWVPNPQVATLTAGSDGDLLQLPDDVYEIQAVQEVLTGNFISRATIAAGTARGNPQAENDWIEFPHGYLSLSKSLDEGQQLKVFYHAFWDKPADANDLTFQIVVPFATMAGIIYYAASHCILPKSVDTATLGPFKTKVDAGTPIHNPLQDQAVFFRKLFYDEMKMMPSFLKAKA